jgi:hypothetical protein
MHVEMYEWSLYTSKFRIGILYINAAVMLTKFGFLKWPMKGFVHEV